MFNKEMHSFCSILHDQQPELVFYQSVSSFRSSSSLSILRPKFLTSK